MGTAVVARRSPEPRPFAAVYTHELCNRISPTLSIAPTSSGSIVSYAPIVRLFSCGPVHALYPV